MKKVVMNLMMFALVTICVGQTTSLVGTWEGKTSHGTLVYIFHANGTYEKVFGNHKEGPYKFRLEKLSGPSLDLILEYLDDDFGEMSSIAFGYKLSSDGKTLTIGGIQDNGKPVSFKKKE
jgi:hypothetical protein